MKNTSYHLNDKFLSSDINDLISFYNSFEKREELIDWMKNRPRNDPQIIHKDGDSSIVVVIPTADAQAQRTLTCTNAIYKGIHQIVVESQKPRDRFFNYSHNVNSGIREALKLNPEWVIISNDDMIPGDESKKLIREVTSKDNRQFNALFTVPSGTYHSFPRFVGTPNSFYSLITKFHPNRIRSVRFELWKRFGLKYLDALSTGATGVLSRLSYTKHREHLLTGSFTMLSSHFLKGLEEVYDEVFINGGEDTDLSLRLYERENQLGFINYRIGDMVGTSLGSGWSRVLRNVVNEVYLSYKIEEGSLHI